MILVKSKSQPNEKVILVAETDSDLEVLKFLYDEHVVFGMWKIYTKSEDKFKNSDEHSFLKNLCPEAAGLAWVSLSAKV